MTAVPMSFTRRSPKPASRPSFTDVTAEAGLGDFIFKHARDNGAQFRQIIQPNFLLMDGNKLMQNGMHDIAAIGSIKFRIPRFKRL